MIRGVIATAWVVLLAACESPAAFFSAECDPLCLDEAYIRIGARDVLTTAPGVWRFYDDFAENHPAACADAGMLGAELVPIWTRTLNPIHPLVLLAQNGHRGYRGAISVSATGEVAVVAGGLLWILDGATGVPSHAFRSADADRINEAEGLLFSSPGHVAFAPDGRLWVKANSQPALINLQSLDRKRGPLVTFSWALQGFSGGTWDSPAQSVASDGTLFWFSSDGTTRALQPDGAVRWESGIFGGTPRVDANDFVYWSAADPARAVAAEDAREVWRPQVLPGWTDSVLTNNENAAIRTLIPVRHVQNFRELLALHRLDGSIATIPHGADGGLPLIPTATAQSASGLWVADRDSIARFDEATGELRWLTQVSSDLWPDLVAGENSEQVFAATRDCRVLALDADGRIARSHQMKGIATGDLMQLRDGILYVLTYLPRPLSSTNLFPGDLSSPRRDGGVPQLDDYECFKSVPTLCGPPIDGELGYVYVLYAFAVE